MMMMMMMMIKKKKKKKKKKINLYKGMVGMEEAFVSITSYFLHFTLNIIAIL